MSYFQNKWKHTTSLFLSVTCLQWANIFTLAWESDDGGCTLPKQLVFVDIDRKMSARVICVVLIGGTSIPFVSKRATYRLYRVCFSWAKNALSLCFVPDAEQRICNEHNRFRRFSSDSCQIIIMHHLMTVETK